MSTPPPELAWIGVIGGIAGVATAILNLLIMWRNRRRIEFRTISANTYYEPWTEWDIKKGGNWPGPPSTKPGIAVGSCRRAFVVVEFAVKSEFPTEIGVGRFMINGWMFSDRYVGMDYAPKHDYRVFDLHTRAQTSLETYVKLPARGSYGLRIEVFEDTDGPAWKSNHSRYAVNLPRNYIVEFQTDIGKRRHKVRFPPAQQMRMDAVHHWSEQLLPLSEYPTLPQGLQYPEWRLPWRARLRDRYRAMRNQLAYGKAYHIPGDRNRLVRAFKKIRFRRLSGQARTTTDNDGTAKGR
jgi:hypothetical protein